MIFPIIKVLVFTCAFYVTWNDILEVIAASIGAKSITINGSFKAGVPIIWGLFFALSCITFNDPEPQAYDYHINVDNDSLYITSPGIDGGQTQHYEISWDDSISVKDIIILDNQ